MNESGNPYYKKRALTPLNESSIAFKLPDEVRTDFLDYIELAYPNKNQALNDIVLNFLNNKCIERKYFNIDVVAICPYDFEDIKLNKCLYLSSKDNYFINRIKAIKNTSSIILNNEVYLNPSKLIDLEDYTNMLNNGNFTDSKIKPIDFIYMNEAISDYAYDNEFNVAYSYSLLYFKVNNFLDEFIDKEFQTPNRNHKGIGYYISDYEDLYFYAYEWKFKNNFEFELLDIGLISENEFKSLILNSSNEDLKKFLKDFKDLSSYDEAISDVPDERNNEELNQRIRELNKMVKEISDLNESLAKENQELKYELASSYNKGVEETKANVEDKIESVIKDVLGKYK